MKKSAIALAVAAALVGFGSAAYADTTLYGSARVSIDYNDPSSSNVLSDNPDSSWDVYNNTSRLGVRGEEDLGGGLSAIYQYEFGVDVTEGGNLNSNRPKWLGLKGSNWGAVTLGTQWTPYYNVIGIGDIFNSSKVFNSASSYGNLANSAQFYNAPVLNTYLGNTFGLRMDNSVIYSTPNWSGFSAQAMLVMNGTCPPTDPQNSSDLCKTDPNNKLPGNLSNNIDMWNISASYKNGPFFAGATYMALEGDSFQTRTPIGQTISTVPAWDGDQWGLAFGYNSGPLAISLAYENGDLNTVYMGTSDNYYLTAQYTFGNNVIRGSYGFLSPSDSRVWWTDTLSYKQGDLNNYAIGYQYNFSKRTRAWLEYLGTSANGDVYGDVSVVSIGTRVDF